MKPYFTKKLLRHRGEDWGFDKADLISDGAGRIRNKNAKRADRRHMKRADKARYDREYSRLEEGGFHHKRGSACQQSC